MTIVLIIAAATVGLTVGIGLGHASALDVIRRSGYVVERVPSTKPARYRIGVRSDAAPVVPAVEWIAPARSKGAPLPVQIGKTVHVDVAALGHKPRGGGRP